jgi:tetratricopeptide (TPR) repeat protein
MTHAELKAAQSVFGFSEHDLLTMAHIKLLCTMLSITILLAAAPAPLHAVQSGDTLAPHGNPVDYEKRIEKLRTSYQLVPLNMAFKHDLAEAYAASGNVFFRQRQYEQADENFLKASELYPDETAFALSRGICNNYLKRYDIARYELERTRPDGPDSVERLYYLGLVLYETDNRQQAMELWELALKLSPDRQELINLLKKARKETAVEDNMDRGNSSRFNLTYDPGVNTSLALAILDVLESAANQVGAELGHFPEARVPVAIYKRADYKDVTDSPDWSGGVYDGTIRLPFGALSEITPPMRAILFHEYAHVVVFDLTRGNCPVWLNEGIAEMFGRKQFTPPAAKAGQAALKGTVIDVRRLEGSFSGLSSNEAALAYQQSYTLVNYLVTAYGWHRVNAILTALGKGLTISAAIASALQDYSLSYDGLIKEWRESLQREAAGL